MSALYVFKRPCYRNIHTFYVYKTSIKHVASCLFLVTLESNAGTTMFTFQL